MQKPPLYVVNGEEFFANRRMSGLPDAAYIRVIVCLSFMQVCRKMQDIHLNIGLFYARESKILKAKRYLMKKIQMFYRFDTGIRLTVQTIKVYN